MTRSHRCWFEALYKDKYEYMGEFDLMSLAFLLDLGLYYFGIVSQPFKHGAGVFDAAIFPADLRAVPLGDEPVQSPVCEDRAAPAGDGHAGQDESRPALADPRFYSEPLRIRVAMQMPLKWVWLELTEGWRSWGAAAVSLYSSRIQPKGRRKRDMRG